MGIMDDRLIFAICAPCMVLPVSFVVAVMMCSGIAELLQPGRRLGVVGDWLARRRWGDGR